MAFIPLQTSDRSAAGLLRQIEHDIITLVARCTSSSIFQARGAILPLFGVPTPSANASGALGLVSTLPCADEPQHINVTNILKPLFPLAQLPEDVCLSVLSFLPAKELCSVRGVNSESLQTADSHADALWGGLCRHDFPSVASLAARGVAADQLCPPHQQYVKNVLQRAGDEVRNLRADYRLRESLDVFNRCTTKHHTTATASTPTTTSNKISVKLKFALRSISHNLGVRTRTHTRSGGTGSSHGGIVGLVSDLVDVPDPLVARALSNKRRAALSTVVVDNDDVLFELRRRNLIGGPVNFLPLSTLHLENTSLLPRILSASTMPPPSAAPPTAARTRGQGARERGTVNGGGVGGHEAGGSVERFDLLPVAPESPAPPGFVGYAVRLLQLRSEHESLRWTVLFTLFKDLAVFETTEQAEAVRARVPSRRLFYYALDYGGAHDRLHLPGANETPQISHWGFQRASLLSWDGGGGEAVRDALARQQRKADSARWSLAFLTGEARQQPTEGSGLRQQQSDGG